MEREDPSFNTTRSHPDEMAPEAIEQSGTVGQEDIEMGSGNALSGEDSPSSQVSNHFLTFESSEQPIAIGTERRGSSGAPPPAPTQTTLVCIKLVSAVGDDVQRWWLHRGRLTGASRILEEAWWFENSAGHQEWITGQSGQHEVRALDAYFSWNDGRESWFVDFVRNQDEDPIMYQWDMIPDLWSIGERVGDTAFQKQILEDLVTLVHYRCKFLQWTFLQPIVGAVMGWANGDGALAAKSPLFTLCVELFAQKTWADQLQEACDGTPVEMHGPLLKAMLKNRYYYPLSYTTTVSVADHL